MSIGDTGTLPVSGARAAAQSHLSALRNGEPSCTVEVSAETPFEDVAEAVFRRYARNWKPGPQTAPTSPTHSSVRPNGMLWCGSHPALPSACALRARCASCRAAIRTDPNWSRFTASTIRARILTDLHLWIFEKSLSISMIADFGRD
ncbi:MAG: hypothetical protein OXL68_03085, partial [Paracoccaceae bacterium]|nr:hypothetical protein [Paracoccaceae bacterium]